MLHFPCLANIFHCMHRMIPFQISAWNRDILFEYNREVIHFCWAIKPVVRCLPTLQKKYIYLIPYSSLLTGIPMLWRYSKIYCGIQIKYLYVKIELVTQVKICWNVTLTLCNIVWPIFRVAIHKTPCLRHFNSLSIILLKKRQRNSLQKIRSFLALAHFSTSSYWNRHLLALLYSPEKIC